MKKNLKNTLSVSTVATILLTSSIAATSVKADTVTVPQNPRLWGQDRYETAVKVSQAGWADGSEYAVIASGQGYADALCAAPLAKVNNAPILLTEQNTLSTNTLNELKRLKVKHVYIVGGQGVVSKAVEDSIKSQLKVDVQRLAGQNRYETAVKVAEKLGTPSKVVLASGAGYADALSAAPVAAIEGMPILLTESGALPSATANYIKANTGITKTYVIGGTASVSDAAMKTTPNPERYGGVDRFDTNAKVVEAFSTDFNFKNAYLALANGPTGNEFADALSGAAIAAKNGNAVIITDRTATTTTKTLAQSKLSPSSTITVIGGTTNIPDSVVSSLKVTATLLGEEGKTYSDAINGNADITADKVKLTGNVKGDLYLEGNNASLSNMTVDGTIYINPGENGVSNLDTVTAKNIVVLSGAKDSIHLKSVKAKNLKVQSRNNARIVSEGTTAIDTTTVLSQAILQATSGSFGNVTLAQTPSNNTVELKGKFDKLVTIEGQVVLKTDGSTKIAGLVISASVKAGDINIEGNGTIVNIQVKSALAVLNLGKSLSVTGKIEAVAKGNIKSDNSSILSKVTEKPASSMSDISNSGSTTTGGGGGGGSTTSYADITSLVSDAYGEKINNYLNSHPKIKDYVNITTGSTITVTINEGKYISVEDVFNSAKTADDATFAGKLGTLESLVNMPFFSNVKASDKTLIDYLKAKYPNYIDKEGNLNAANIQAKMKTYADYAAFKADLEETIASKATAAGITAGPSISLSLNSSGYSGIAIDHITKDTNTTVYASGSKVTDNVNNIINLDTIDKLVGNYVIYVKDSTGKISTIKVNVAKNVLVKNIAPQTATAQQGAEYTLPTTVKAEMYDGTTKDVAVKWNTTAVDTSKAGTFKYEGTVEGYNTKVELTLNVTEATITSIDPITATVQQGAEYTLPTTVEAKFSNGTTNKVAVTWEPKTVDTSKVGTVTYTGTVSGYNSTVTLTLTVTGTETSFITAALFEEQPTANILYITVADATKVTGVTVNGTQLVLDDRYIIEDGKVKISFSSATSKDAIGTVTIKVGDKEYPLNPNMITE